MVREEEEISIGPNIGNDYLNKKQLAQILFKLIKKKLIFLLKKFYFLNVNYDCYPIMIVEITQLLIHIYIKTLLFIYYVFKKLNIFKIL